MLSPSMVRERATAHNQLGAIYGRAGDYDRAVPHFRESIRLEEGSGDIYRAARTRFNVAVALADSGRFADAREYALAALRNFEMFGESAAQDIQDTQQLLAQIEQDIAKGVAGSK